MELDINKYVQEALDELDIKTLVKVCIKEVIDRDVREELKVVVRTEAKDLVQKSIDAYLKKPVKLNDGWGNTEELESFEVLFKREAEKALKDSYRVRETIERTIKDKVAQYLHNNTKEVTDSLMNLMLKDLPKQ